MKSKLKKSLSLLLALVMCLSVMSVGAFASSDAVASVTINGVTEEYKFLYKAFEDVNNAGGGTVTLLKDVDAATSRIQINNPGSYTIDGDGYTITLPSNATGGIFGIYGKADDSTALKCELINIKFAGKVGDDTSKVGGTHRKAVHASHCELTVTDCNFTTTNAYGIESRNWSKLTVSNCSFSGSTYGGAIYHDAGNGVVIQNCSFTDNTVEKNGVIYVSKFATDAHIKNNTFSGNTVSANGCAVVYLSGAAVVSGNLFEGNTVSGTQSGSKEGVIVLGSEAGGANITGNAFVNNTLGDQVDHYATVYNGYTGTDKVTTLSNNYWDGKDTTDTTDIYDPNSTATNTGIAMYYTEGTTGATVSDATYVGYVKSLGANVGNTIYLNVKMVFTNPQEGMRLKYQIGDLAPTYFSLPTPDANGVYLFQIPVIAKYFGVQGTISLVDATDETVYDISKGVNGKHVTSVQYSVYDYLDLLEKSNVAADWLDLSTAIRNLGNMTAKHWKDSHNEAMANRGWIAYPAAN